MHCWPRIINDTNSSIHLVVFSATESILLKRSLESVVCISLYYQLQTPADSESIYRSSLNFQRIFPTSRSPISVKSNYKVQYLLFKNHFFYPKIQNFVKFMFLQCLYHQCLILYQNWCNVTCFIKIYSTIPTPKIGKFSKVMTFEKSILYPLVLKSPIIVIIKSIYKICLSLIYLVLITEQVCKSQILKCFTCSKIFGKTQILWFFLNNCRFIMEIHRCAITYSLIMLWKFHAVSIIFKTGAGV